jgi:hypothetical protein
MHMNRRDWIGSLTLMAMLCTGTSQGEDLPHLQRNGDAIQLMVDGAPYLALGGGLHNSSASSPEYMKPLWDRLEQNGVHTVIGTASWELAEPGEGHYDFTAVDEQIKQARADQMRLVMIWFGAYKNAESNFAPLGPPQLGALSPRAARSGRRSDGHIRFFEWASPQRIWRQAGRVGRARICGADAPYFRG